MTITDISVRSREYVVTLCASNLVAEQPCVQWPLRSRDKVTKHGGGLALGANSDLPVVLIDACRLSFEPTGHARRHSTTAGLVRFSGRYVYIAHRQQPPCERPFGPGQPAIPYKSASSDIDTGSSHKRTKQRATRGRLKRRTGNTLRKKECHSPSRRAAACAFSSFAFSSASLMPPPSAMRRASTDLNDRLQSGGTQPIQLR